MSAFPPPTAFGAPKRFTSWRPHQVEAIYDAEGCETRVMGQVHPTGAGKTTIYMTMALSRPGRTIVLVRTKALQDQTGDDWAGSGLVQIKGANAYPCKALEPGGEFYQLYGRSLRDPTCDEGPCHSGLHCSLKEGGCIYYDQLRAARLAKVVGTNYTCWMAANQFGSGFGDPFDLMVCDEAHEAPDALSDFLSVKLSAYDLGLIGAQPLDGSPTLDQWKTWATVHRDRLADRVENLSGAIRSSEQDEQRPKGSVIRELTTLKRLLQSLSVLATDLDETWVAHVERDLSFTPAWPAPYAEDTLFRKIPQILLVSATIRAKTSRYLGIKKRDFTLQEYPSTFPVKRRPVYVMRGSIRASFKAFANDPNSQKLWLARIDNIIRARRDRKIIIPTVSYPRAQWIYQHSRHRDIMLTHTSYDTRRAIERFRAARPPCVFVSPAVGTGYDFPYDACEVVIICKIPFPSPDPVLRARELIDPDYGAYMAMQSLVQAAGRGMRSADDRCEIFIVDGMWGWFKQKYAAFAPKWFLDAVRVIDQIPPAPPKLERRAAGLRTLGRAVGAQPGREERRWGVGEGRWKRAVARSGQ